MMKRRTIPSAVWTILALACFVLYVALLLRRPLRIAPEPPRTVSIGVLSSGSLGADFHLHYSSAFVIHLTVPRETYVPGQHLKLNGKIVISSSEGSVVYAREFHDLEVLVGMYYSGKRDQPSIVLTEPSVGFRFMRKVREFHVEIELDVPFDREVWASSI